ncbi:MAG TPA: DUF488 domain-containing protein [Candidatus Nitrosotenuis sp.]|nr:DUF488 domain-containing protein [Candidatus Nitrosotenuis sp.]
MIKIKRVYETPSRTDGVRVLVDRLWPRGLSKKHACVSVWEKDMAPSDDLRKWFGHDPKKWKEFKSLYFKELVSKKETLSEFLGKVKHKKFTLLYAAKDTERNNAICLKEFLEKIHNV